MQDVNEFRRKLALLLKGGKPVGSTTTRKDGKTYVKMGDGQWVPASKKKMAVSVANDARIQEKRGNLRQAIHLYGKALNHAHQAGDSKMERMLHDSIESLKYDITHDDDDERSKEDDDHLAALIRNKIDSDKR